MIYLVAPYSFIETDGFEIATVEQCLEYFKNHEIIACDTETQGKDPRTKKILSLQLGDSQNQFVIDVRHINILLFKNLLETKKIIFHNAKFDYKFLKHAGIIVENIIDTMLAECVIYSGFENHGYSLLALAKRYLNVDLDKSTRGDFFKLKDEPFNKYQIIYAAKDVEILLTIYEKQKKLIEKYSLEYVVNLEFEVVKSLADIEYNGMLLDVQAWKNNIEIHKSNLETIKRDLDIIVLNDPLLKELFGLKYKQLNLFDIEEREVLINYDSPSQMLKVINALGFSLSSTGDKEISKLSHEFIDKFRDYRKEAKIVSTYGESFLEYVNPVTKRVHTEFWQVVSTGRVSSGSKDSNAPNLQNIPASNSFRNCFISPEGWSWISLDYSGQELCIMADASNEKGFINVLNNGEDLHCFVGSIMFGKTITKADKELRQTAKSLNFGKPYGMGPPKLADTLNISIIEAENLFRIYAKSFPVLDKWLKNQGAKAKKTMQSRTLLPSNRVRWYPKMKEAKIERTSENPDWKKIFTIEGETERNGMNHPIQGKPPTALIKSC